MALGDFIQPQPVVFLVGLLQWRIKVIHPPLRILVTQLVEQAREGRRGDRRRGRHLHHGRGDDDCRCCLIKDIGQSEAHRGGRDRRIHQHVPQRGVPLFLNHHRPTFASRIVVKLNPIREGRRRSRRHLPRDTYLTAGPHRPDIHHGRLVEGRSVGLANGEHMFFVTRQHGPAELPGQQIGALRVFNGGILVIVLHHGVHHDILGLIDGDGVRFPPLPRLAEISESPMQRTHGPLAGQRLEKPAVTGERRGGNGQTRHPNEMPVTARRVLEPAPDKCMVPTADWLPDPSQHRVPALALHKGPHFRPSGAAAPFAAVVVLDVQIWRHIGEAYRCSGHIAAPERPHRSRPETILPQGIRVGSLSRAVRDITGESGVKAQIVGLRIEA